MEALFAVHGISAVPLDESDIPRLQQFFEANADYFTHLNGVPPRPGEAHEEFHDRPPAEFGWTAAQVVGFRLPGGRLVGVASIILDLFAPGVWHIGLFIVDVSLHGTGTARSFYEALEAWCFRQGAQFMRLGVVVGNAKGEAFWEKMGFHEVRRREGMAFVAANHTVRVMVKPLADAGFAAYLAQVARDRPE